MDWHGLVSISEAQAKERGRADVHRNFYAQVREAFLNIFGGFEKIKTNNEKIHIFKILQDPRNTTNKQLLAI